MPPLLLLPVLGTIGLFGWCLIAIIVLPMILSPFFQSAQRKRRRAAFAAMGLTEKTRTEVFGNDPKHIARVIHDSPIASISPWVGVGGRSGDVALFDLTTDFDSNSTTKWTVIGFRLPGPLPDFEIHHTLLGDKLAARISRLLGVSQTPPVSPTPTQTPSQTPPAAGAAAPSIPPVVRTTIKIGGIRIGSSFNRAPQQKITLDGNEQFSQKYRVYTSNPALMPRVVTSSFMDKLVEMDSGTLHLVCGAGWLFVYHFDTRAVPPEKYAQRFEEAVDLISRLNLQAGIDDGAQAAATA